VQLKNSLLYGVFADKASNMDRFLLTNAMHPLDCLFFNRWISSRVNQENMVCCHQIESNSSCLQRNQENEDAFIFFKLFQNFCSFPLTH
jgi:hypothetical protein